MSSTHIARKVKIKMKIQDYDGSHSQMSRTFVRSPDFKKQAAQTLSSFRGSDKSARLNTSLEKPKHSKPQGGSRMSVSSDIVFRRTGLTVGYVAGTQRDKPFGTDEYRAPFADHAYKISTMGTNKENRKNFA